MVEIFCILDDIKLVVVTSGVSKSRFFSYYSTIDAWIIFGEADGPGPILK